MDDISIWTGILINRMSGIDSYADQLFIQISLRIHLKYRSGMPWADVRFMVLYLLKTQRQGISIQWITKDKYVHWKPCLKIKTVENFSSNNPGQRPTLHVNYLKVWHRFFRVRIIDNYSQFPQPAGHLICLHWTFFPLDICQGRSW